MKSTKIKLGVLIFGQPKETDENNLQHIKYLSTLIQSRHYNLEILTINEVHSLGDICQRWRKEIVSSRENQMINTMSLQKIIDTQLNSAKHFHPKLVWVG